MESINSKIEKVLALQLSEISKTDTTRSNSYAERKMIKFMQRNKQWSPEAELRMDSVDLSQVIQSLRRKRFKSNKAS